MDYHEVSHYVVADDFYDEVKNRVSKVVDGDSIITLISLDFDNFNYVNDVFTYEIGNRVLQIAAEHFSTQLKGTEIFTKIHADHFVLCLEESDYSVIAERFSQLTKLKDKMEKVLPSHHTLVISGGVVVVEDNSTPMSALLDMANYARKRAKGNTRSSYQLYDSKMNDEVEWQKIVTLTMGPALENKEFEMYLQPKILIKSGEVIGAEALVRWISPKYGMIYPDNFIPIMEQSGFICDIDFFMLREACRFLKESHQSQIPQLPISVNFSKAHLATDKLVEKIFWTVNRFGIPTHLIEIEFTESLSTENYDQLVEIVSELKMLGFRVLLDDFGSAYSSLNCLKDIPIELIKIDKGFLNAKTNTGKGKLIISKVVELIKSLRMLSVMEGVETKEQEEFLKKLSCDFGQGFFYSKPMPERDYIYYIKKRAVLSDLNAYIADQKCGTGQSYLSVMPQEFQMDNWELYTLGKNIDMGLMKGYLDGEATVEYINDRALEYLGYTRREFRENVNNSIVAFAHPDDAHIIEENTRQLVESGESLQFQTRAIRKDGKVIILQGRSSCVIDSQGRPVGIYAFQDVTEEWERAEALRISEEKYRMVVEQSDLILFDWDFESDTITWSDKYEKLFGRQPNGKNMTTNETSRKFIHPDDLEIFESWVATTYKQKNSKSVEFRVVNAAGEYITVGGSCTSICNDVGEPVKAVGVFQER